MHVDAAYAKSLLPAVLAYLYDYLPFMHGLEIGNVATFCGGDPPIIAALPTAQQIVEFVSGSNLSSYLNVNTFLQNLTKTYLWYGLCQCSDLTSPALPSTPANPGNLIAVNPPGVVSLPTPTPCLTSMGTDQAQGGGSYTFRNNASLAGLNATLLRATAHNTILTAPGSSTTSTIVFWDVSNAVIAAYGVTHSESAGSGATVFDLPIPPNATSVHANESFGGSGTSHHSIDFAIYCGGQLPTAPQTPCCPPDPVATGLLNQILGLVTLIQRQAVPFSYIASTAHAALSGSGTIAISGLIGAKVSITTLPTQLGQAGTLPVEIFDAGFITFSTPDGYPQSVRIEHNPQLLLPARCSAYTALNYDLHPGVVATITELVREP